MKTTPNSTDAESVEVKMSEKNTDGVKTVWVESNFLTKVEHQVTQTASRIPINGDEIHKR